MKPWARIALASAVVILLGSGTEAPARAATVGVGGELRNGDWLAVEPVVLFPVAGSEDRSDLGVTARGVFGVGGSGAAIGLAAGPGGPCNKLEPSTPFGSSIALDARVERMYGPSSWRHTVYAGPQLSFGGIFAKWSVGWMFDVHDKGDNHLQLGFGGGW